VAPCGTMLPLSGLIATTKKIPLLLVALFTVLRIQSVPTDADRDHGLLPAIRWLLQYLVPMPGIHWIRSPHFLTLSRQRQMLPTISLDGNCTASQQSGRPLNILCMDGGGMRGLNLLVMAEEIELQTGKPLASLFDLVAGTSIGGCGALFINKYPAPGEATRMARLALRELQERCFAPYARSRRSLLWDGHLCLDRRREFMLEICGEMQPLRLPKGLPRYWQGRGPRAFAVASRRRRGGGLEPFLFRTYKAIPATMGERRKRQREMRQVERKALQDAARQWEEQARAEERRTALKRAQARQRWHLPWVGTAAPPPPLKPETVPLGAKFRRYSWWRHPLPAFRRWMRWRLERRQRQLAAAKDRMAAAVRRALGAYEHGLAGTSDAQMWQAIEATSAAPSIFPRARLGGLSLADGGLVANNPTVIALREARALWPGRRIGVIVSLGTGSARPQSTSEAPEEVASLAPGAAYFRIEPPASGVSIIESDAGKLRRMEKATRAHFRSCPTARELCRKLVMQQWWELFAHAAWETCAATSTALRSFLRLSSTSPVPASPMGEMRKMLELEDPDEPLQLPAPRVLWFLRMRQGRFRYRDRASVFDPTHQEDATLGEVFEVARSDFEGGTAFVNSARLP